MGRPESGEGVSCLGVGEATRKVDMRNDWAEGCGREGCVRVRGLPKELPAGEWDCGQRKDCGGIAKGAACLTEKDKRLERGKEGGYGLGKRSRRGVGDDLGGVLWPSFKACRQEWLLQAGFGFLMA